MDAERSGMSNDRTTGSPSAEESGALLNRWRLMINEVGSDGEAEATLYMGLALSMISLLSLDACASQEPSTDERAAVSAVAIGWIVEQVLREFGSPLETSGHDWSWTSGRSTRSLYLDALMAVGAAIKTMWHEEDKPLEGRRIEGQASLLKHCARILCVIWWRTGELETTQVLASARTILAGRV